MPNGTAISAAMRQAFLCIAALFLFSLPSYSQTNLFNPAAIAANTDVEGSNGVVISNAGTSVSGFIPVVSGATYTTSGGMLIGGTRPCYYDSSEVWVSCDYAASPDILRSAGGNLTIPSVSNIAFIRYTINSSNTSSEMFCPGTTCPSSYVAYVAPVLPAPTLVLSPIGNKAYNAQPFTVSAATNSSAAVTYTVVSGPAIISGTTVTLSGVNGTVVIGAQVASDVTHAAASTTGSFLVTGAPRSTGLVTVSGTTIVDSTGVPATNATLCATPAAQSGTAISSRLGGGGQVTKTQVCTNVANGAFSIQLPDTSLTLPQNVCYAITVVDNLTGDSLLDAGYSCVQPTSASASLWCSTPAGVTTCNFDNYPVNLPSLALQSAGPAGANGLSAYQVAVANGYTGSVSQWLASLVGGATASVPGAPVAGSILYFNGSSITAGQGISPTLAFPALVGNSAWGKLANTYNKGVPGQTSAGVLAQYTTEYPSAHEISPAVTGNTAPCWYILDLTEVTNDYDNHVSITDSISHLQAITSAAHADGYKVVLMSSPILGNGYPAYDPSRGQPFIDPYNIQWNLAVATAARNKVIYWDQFIELSDVIPDQTSTVFYQDGTHPTVLGHAALASAILSALASGGSNVNFNAGYHHNPQTFEGGAILMDVNGGKWLLTVSTSGAMTAVAQ